MIHIIRKLFPLLLTLLGSSTAFANVICDASGNSKSFQLPQGMTVAANLPDGSIVWDSGPLSFNYRCHIKSFIGPITLSIYINPENTQLGSGIQMGVHYNGKLYTRTGEKIPVATTTWVCGIGGVPAYCQEQAEFTVEASVVLFKQGDFPESGVITREISYKAFNVDSHSAPSTGSYRFGPTLYGLNYLRSSTCAPTLDIEPGTINFLRTFARDAQPNKVASSAEFSLTLSKVCSKDVFATEARLVPVSGTAINDMLIPSDNDSVGIAIKRIDNNLRTPLNKWFRLHGHSFREVIRIPFQADLIWRTDKPQIGAFDTGLIVELTHY